MIACRTAVLCRQPREAIFDYLRDIGRRPKFTKVQEHELILRAKAGDKSARDLIIQSALLLVVKPAKDVAKKYPCLNLEDLIQEGNISLLEAFQKFDPNRGVRFSTFAFRRVKWKMQLLRLLSSFLNIMNIPAEAVSEAIAMDNLQARLRDKLGFPPTDDELREAKDFSQEKLERIKCAARRVASLNGDDEGRRLTSHGNSNCSDDFVKSTDDRLDSEVFWNSILGAMRNLSFRKQEIIKRLYGLGGSEALSHRGVGKLFGISKQRVRQLEVLLLSYLHAKPQIRKIASRQFPGINFNMIPSQRQTQLAAP